MTLRIHNTLTRQKEEFRPREPGRVSMYFCGPTPYSNTHLGHIRPALTADIIARYLKHRGFRVTYISNFTDIDDKIINRAREEGVSPSAISTRYIDEYLTVMREMGIDQVDQWVRVTEHIPQIIEMVQGLVDRGRAYVVDGDVYYDVTKMPDYGKLSGRCLDEMIAGARVAVDERKRHPMDFALWKSAKPGEPYWDSPWGPGRPGWHIECSAMSLHYLGNGFDIHGGGEDLIFPHHENEIAQAEGFTGEAPFVRYWVHNGLIQINEEKMSKSLGNFVTAREILDRHSPQAIRLFMLTTHYRNPLNFSWQALEDAERAWQKAARAIEELEAIASNTVTSGETGHPELIDAANSAMNSFYAAMNDDFNTALALASFFELLKACNSTVNSAAPGSLNPADMKRGLRVLRMMLEVLGFPRWTAQRRFEADGHIVEGLMQIIIDLRNRARKNRDFALADEIRGRLSALGIVLEDTPHGTRWKR